MRGMTWLATLAVAAMACGRGGTGARANAPTVPQGSTGSAQPSAAPPQAGPPCDGTVTLVARGVDAGALNAFKLDVTNIELKAGGVALTPTWSAAGSTLSLAGTETPELAAVQRVTGPVDVTIRFGDVLACEGSGCFNVDTCAAPITFQYDLDRSDANGCHVFLQLDLASSVQPIVGGQTFLPSFSVKYW